MSAVKRDLQEAQDMACAFSLEAFRLGVANDALAAQMAVAVAALHEIAANVQQVGESWRDAQRRDVLIARTALARMEKAVTSDTATPEPPR